jgi:hypothetical protein
MEHRWGERFSVDLAVRITARPYAVRSGRLVDLSLSGCAVRIAADLRVLNRVQIAIALPNRFAHPTPVVAGYIVRRSKDGIGVEWAEFAPTPVIELVRLATIHRNGQRNSALRATELQADQIEPVAATAGAASVLALRS